MRRREFITLLGGAAASWPLAARAQEPSRVYRLGALAVSPRTMPYFVAMFDELRRLGFAEGQNLIIDWRQFGSHVDLLPEFAAELVQAKVDVIYATGDLAIRAAQQATTTIPILGATDDMVGSGLVNSLARLGGNTTGVSILSADLDGKRQEILIDAVQGMHHLAALADPNTSGPTHLQALHDAARAHGVDLLIYRITAPDDISAAIDAAKAEHADALNVLGSTIFYASRQTIIQRVAALRLPTMFAVPEQVEEGGLVAYGPRILHLYREIVSRQLAKLLRGTKPADLPVEQPTKFELAINLTTAKALGLTIPEAFLLRADEVIE